MLLILYGAIAEMGLKSREYLNKIGFHTVEKLNYAVAPQMTTKYGTRNFVSEEEFMENTDSLFRYEVGGIRVGFNQRQISDAVCDKTDSLLTLSAKDISFLSEIKRVYADKVCLVYAYIDDATLRGIVYGLKDITDDEARVRLETGRDVKRGYLKFRSIFDHVVMYGGEDSEFDYESLYRQFDAIVGARTLDKTDGIRYADVLISSARRDREIYAQIRTALMKRGISVFDDGDIPAGEEPVSVISEAIQKAKIVIPVVTANSLSGKWVMAETRFTLESAEKNGTFILPVFEEGIDLDAAPVIKERLERLSCVFIENGEVENAAERLADRIYKLLSAEAELKAYAKRVDNYLFLKMHDQAKCWQEAHLGLCDEVFATSGGAFIDFEACLLSRIKLISILMDMRSYGEALDCAVEALNYLDDGDTYDLLIDQFSLCCVHLGMDEDAVRTLALERMDEFRLCDESRQTGGRLQDYMHSHLENLIDRFRNALRTAGADLTGADTETDDREEGKSRIAQHGESAIALFEDIIENCARSASRHDLMLGYERILNYCKHMGLKGDVADRCISRIAELSHFEEASADGADGAASVALKIYLGQTLPMSGEYDVFISYKSEDEALAKKVYDYLTQSGKEVFFAKETLPQLGESEYRAAIFNALDHSRHMVVIGSNPDYLKTNWVKKEWDTFDNELTENEKKAGGTLILVLSDDIVSRKGALPIELRTKEIVKMSEFRSRLLSYLR